MASAIESGVDQSVSLEVEAGMVYAAVLDRRRGERRQRTRRAAPSVGALMRRGEAESAEVKTEDLHEQDNRRLPDRRQLDDRRGSPLADYENLPGMPPLLR